MSQNTSCPDWQQVSQFLHKKLPPDAYSRLEDHFQNCKRCRQALSEISLATQDIKPLRKEQEVAHSVQTHSLLAAKKLSPLPKAAVSAQKHQSLEATNGEALASHPEQGHLLHYRILEMLGRGGMGSVYKAFDEKLNRVVAIKVMAVHLLDDPMAFRRFSREAVTAAASNSDNIVTVYGVEECDGLPFLVMEYVEGQSLQARLDEEGPLPIEEILRIGSQIAQGLAAAHAKGIIHRDIKPANILLADEGGRVKIVDFGLAKALQDEKLTRS